MGSGRGLRRKAKPALLERPERGDRESREEPRSRRVDPSATRRNQLCFAIVLHSSLPSNRNRNYINQQSWQRRLRCPRFRTTSRVGITCCEVADDRRQQQQQAARWTMAEGVKEQQPSSYAGSGQGKRISRRRCRWLLLLSPPPPPPPSPTPVEPS